MKQMKMNTNFSKITLLNFLNIFIYNFLKILILSVRKVHGKKEIH